MATAVAVIVTDLEHTRLGLPSRVGDTLGGRSVLAQTIGRAVRIPSVRTVVVLHPQGQHPGELFDRSEYDKPVRLVADPDGLRDAFWPMRTAARKWALTAWRGGLGGALCYDELLPAKAILQAMQKHNADAAVLLGGDWPLIDPALCEKVLAQHLAHPKEMKMTFTQVPPGLAGVAIGASLLEGMQDNTATLGQLIAYDPSRPQGDPIGRDVCIQVPAAVRNCAGRFIYDTPRTVAMIDALVDHLASRFEDADASAVTDAFVAMTGNGQADAFGRDFADLPQQVTLELNTTRPATGPVAPQHHVQFDRAPIELGDAMRIVGQLGAAGDVALTLGGLGDPLEHEHFAAIVTATHEAGVLGIAVETDLLGPPDRIETLLDLPVDVVSVRLNADSRPTYEKLMGTDRFDEVTSNIEHLLNTRNRRAREASENGGGQSALAGVPWIVPRFIKTADNLAELEAFFDRWMYFTRCTVIESPTTGGGAVPDTSLMHMAPPRRYGCRQLARRLTVHCDGKVALCDQDWQGEAAVGDALADSMTAAWNNVQTINEQHRAGQWDQLQPCAGCDQWHRP